MRAKLLQREPLPALPGHHNGRALDVHACRLALRNFVRPADANRLRRTSADLAGVLRLISLMAMPPYSNPILVNERSAKIAGEADHTECDQGHDERQQIGAGAVE